jgi:hypothetical protein
MNEPTSDALKILRALNAGRVTIPTPDFLEFIADRLDRAEGRDLGDTMGGVDYCIRLRTLAAALRKETSKWERD